jgi:hypothetical protein
VVAEGWILTRRDGSLGSIIAKLSPTKLDNENFLITIIEIEKSFRARGVALQFSSV